MSISFATENRRRFVLGVALIGIVAASNAAINTDWQSGGGDDAYITYRYAENIARGQGFVFNPGESPVLGTTTPLYALILAAAAKAGTDIPTVSLSIGVLGLAIALIMVFLLAHDLGLTVAGFAVAITWSLSAVPIQHVSGMETPLYMALIVGALFAAVRARPSLALTLAALAAITRPDGLAIVVAIVALFVVGRKWSWRSAAPATLILGGWIAYATLTFGSPIPTSGVAKMTHDPVISGTFSILDPQAFELMLPFVSLLPHISGLIDTPLGRVDALVFAWLGAVMVAAQGLGLGVVMVFARAHFSRAILLWTLLYAVGYSALHLPSFGWYYAPLSLLLGLVFWSGVADLVLRLSSARLAAAGVASVAAVLGLATLVADVGSRGSPDAQPHRQAGIWLRDHAQPGQTIVAYEVGTVAYLSNLRTIDILGLTEPAALAYVSKGDYAWAIRTLPDYVFIAERTAWPVTAAIYAEPTFAMNYREVARFKFRSSLDYLLFARV